MALSVKEGAQLFDVEYKSLTHNSIVFNVFIFCQIFNEYTARNLGDQMNPFHGVLKNHTFLYVSALSVGCQILLIEFGGTFVGTAPLPLNTFLITIGLGAVSLVIGVLQRFILVKEDPNSFFDSSTFKMYDKLESDDYSIAVIDHESVKPNAKSVKTSKIFPSWF